MLNAYGAVPIMGPWQGGLAQPVGPPSRPRFGTGALTLVSQTDASSGSVVPYVGGIFAAQFWTVGHPVPFLVRELDPRRPSAARRAVRAARGAERRARRGPAAGVRRGGRGVRRDPVGAVLRRALARDLHPRSRRGIGGAQLAQRRDRNSAREPAGGRGPVAHPSQPAGELVPLRDADLRSLIAALAAAERTTGEGIDPLWSELREFAQAALSARDRRRFW